MRKKLLSTFLVMSLLFGSISGLIPITAAAAKLDVSDHIVEQTDAPLRLYYDEEASHGVSAGYDDVDTSFGSGYTEIEKHVNDDWERWSIPLGNGYVGANIFGRTETERIQLTEKTLANPYRITSGSPNTDGLNNFSETYIDFGHTNSAVSRYSRELDLKTAVSTVSYQYGGVTYTREYFTSYPDKAMVIKLDASGSGNLSFTLRPTIPYEQEYMNTAGDKGGKWGEVTSSVSDGVGTIELTGKLEYFDIDFMGLYKVYTNGGTVTATTTTNKYGDTDGTITVSGATSAYIVITMGTDYELVSEQFTGNSSDESKPTYSTGLDEARAKVEGYMSAVSANIKGKSFDDAYNTLKTRHLNDYQNLFGRVSLDLDFNESDFALTTDALLTNYKNGSGSTYLEALYFQYGRYLLIASSRKGALPANLQGVWNRYNHAPWSAGYWHNINVQMNYWPAFSTNLAETFEAYVDYNVAYMAEAESGSNSIVSSYNPSVYGQDGGNGWSIATGGYVSDVDGSTSIGNLGFTTQLFWEYYEYTKDETLLREVVYPVLVGAARFITKMVKEDADGNFIALYTDSPEQYVDGVWYYTDKGTAYAQSFAYQNNYNMLLAAKELGISFEDTTHEDYAIIQRVLEQIDKYDPVRIGLSGHVKEFFEEEYYGDLGEYTHRHISQLVGLYPGNVINGATPAWLDAAEYVLTERGDKATGWGVAHRLNLWTRVQNGERAYDLLEQLLKNNTATNLWDLHPPFQIDGNLGGTAGISEMLLQSHAGYIAPLAAIPASWANGSYTGLVARGNFEVSARWSDSTLTDLNIKSLKGGEVSVKYGGISGVTVCDSDGNVIKYTYENGIITFDTEAGKTYVIWGFEKQIQPEEVTGLSVESDFLSKYTLTWNASADAVAYNVYVAKDNDAAYTLLGSTKGNSFVYKPKSIENPRLTFAVTAVNSSGVEGDRSLVYKNPENLAATADDISASIIDGELQVAIKSNEYANKYRLYSRNKISEPWVLVQESSYPIIIEKDYSSLLKYGVSVVNYFGEESEISNVSKFNNAPVSIDYSASNILSKVQFNPTPSANAKIHAVGYGYQTLTDGSFVSNSGRFSTKTANDVFFDATAALPGTFLLGELRIFDFDPGDTYANNVGSSLKIELLNEGVWTTVYDCADTAEILSHRAKTPAGTRYLSFDLSGHTAQMIRITAPSPVSGKSISIYEIECSGVCVPETKLYNENILLGKEFILTDASTKHLNSASGKAEALTDGTLKVADSGSTIFYTWYNQTDMQFDGTVYFGSAAVLNTLRVYDYRGETNWANACGPQVIIQARVNGEWITVHDVTITGGAGNNISEYRKSGTRSNSASGTTEYWLEFNLGGINADAIRIYLPPKSSNNYGMYEIECDGYYLDDGSAYSSNIFEGYEFTAASTASALWKGTYANLTDGDYTDNGRVVTHGKPTHIDGTLSFGNYVAALDTLTIDFSTYSQARCGSALIIQILDNGIWKDALNITHDRAYQGKVTFDLKGAKGSAVRLYIPSVYPDAYENLLTGDNIAIHEITCSGTLTPCDTVISPVDDVFDGFVFAPTDSTAAGNIWSPNTYDKLTDNGAINDTNSRMATSSGKPADGTLDFGGKVFALGTLTVNFDPYTATRCGQDFSVYVYYKGEWKQVINHVHTAPVKVETFDLGGVLAEKVRFTVSGKYAGGANADGQSGDTIIIYEMSCSGAEIPSADIEDKEDKDNIFEGYEFEAGETAGAVWYPNTYDKITDGGYDNNTRFVTSSGATADGVLDFCGKVALLDTLTVTYDPNNKGRCGDDITIYVYRNGAWTQVLYYKHTAAVTSKVFNLGGIEAEQVRFVISGKYTGTDLSGADNEKADTICIYEMTCSGSLIIPAATVEDKSSNVILGTTADRLTVENATVHPGTAVKDLTNAFDGDKTSTRYAVMDAAGAYSLVIDLGENIPLYTLSIYDWRGSETVTRSDKTKIELYIDDCWIPIIVDKSLTMDAPCTDFDLMGLTASKIRITFENTKENKKASIFEITCTTGSASAVDRRPLLDAYKELEAINTNGDAAYEQYKQDKLDELKNLLMDTEASADDITEYVDIVTAAAQKVETGLPVTDAHADVNGYNLTLSDDVAVNFYANVDASVSTQFPDAVAIVQHSDGTLEEISLNALPKDSTGRVIITTRRLATQMSDTLKVRIKFDTDNYGDMHETSIAAYANTILNDPTYEAANPGVNELVKSMLNYGSYAQLYFNYNVENLANEGIYTSSDNPVLNGDFSGVTAGKPSSIGSVNGLSAAGWTLALESDIEIRFYFATYNIHNYSFSVTKPNGEVAELEPAMYEDIVYRVEIPVEDVALIDDTYVLTITDLETGSERKVSFSAVMYVNSIISGSVSSTPELMNIAKAIKLYNIAANNYRRNNP